MKSYAKIARQVDLAMRHTDKPCIGEQCDDVITCKRHERTIALVLRVTEKSPAVRRGGK